MLNVSFCSKSSLEKVDTDHKLIFNAVVKYSLQMQQRGLLPDIRRSLNDNFFLQQDGVPAHCSRHTVAYLRSHVPEFTEQENWPPNSPDLNPVDYSVSQFISP